MEVQRFKIPKYRIGRYVLNFLEFQNFIYEVEKGIKEGEYKAKDMKGNTIIIAKGKTTVFELMKLHGYTKANGFQMRLKDLKRI